VLLPDKLPLVPLFRWEPGPRSSRDSRITLLLGERTCEVFVGARDHVGDRDLGGFGIKVTAETERVGTVDVVWNYFVSLPFSF
jgi:hypothetical protein